MAIIGPLPVIINNGDLTDATKVMQDMNYIASQTNANAADLHASNTFSSPQVVAGGTARNHLITAGQVQDETAAFLTGVAGTNAITGSVAFGMTSYVVGQIFNFIAAGTNTGPVTLNINGIGVISVVKNGSQALVAGDITSGAAYTVFYDNTGKFQIQTFAAYPSNYQTFTANGTWTKPTGLSGNEIAIIQLWGSGAGGGDGGGGGGDYLYVERLAAGLSASVAITVGAAPSSGTIGNNTTFGVLYTAYGGGNGTAGQSGGGGGGGSNDKGSANAGATGGAGGIGFSSRVAPVAGADGGSDAGGGGGTGAAGGSSFWGGGGGGASGSNGGTSTFGGGGGAGIGGTGGVSLFGGAGGNAGVAGTAPGGGGGSGAAGARGEARIWIV